MTTGGIIGLTIGVGVAMLIIGVLLGFFIGQKYFKKQIDENPPITRESIKDMYAQMGRTLSESQINDIMARMKRSNKSN